MISQTLSCSDSERTTGSRFCSSFRAGTITETALTKSSLPARSTLEQGHSPALDAADSLPFDGLSPFDCATIPQSLSGFEDADYEGHSLSALKRIAEALGCRQVEIRFVPKRIRRT